MEAASLESTFTGLKELHSSQSSALFLGTRRTNGQEVVLKSYEHYMEAVAEAYFLRTLQPCINVCSLIEVLHLGQELYTVLEPCTSDLHSVLRKHQVGWPSGDVRQLGAQILHALDFMHERQIAYFALRPRNVLLQPPPGGGVQGSVVKLIHFKQAQQMSAAGLKVDREARPAGMLRYDAPELLAGDTCTSATDIFSFGCVLGEMITGRPLFTGAQPRDMLLSVVRSLGAAPPPCIQAAMRKDPALKEVLAQLEHLPTDTPLKNRLALCKCDEELRGAVLACLALDPEQRPSAKQLLLTAFRGVVDTDAFQELQREHEGQPPGEPLPPDLLARALSASTTSDGACKSPQSPPRASPPPARALAQLRASPPARALLHAPSINLRYAAVGSGSRRGPKSEPLPEQESSATSVSSAAAASLAPQASIGRGFYQFTLPSASDTGSGQVPATGHHAQPRPPAQPRLSEPGVRPLGRQLSHGSLDLLNQVAAGRHRGASVSRDPSPLRPEASQQQPHQQQQHPQQLEGRLSRGSSIHQRSSSAIALQPLPPSDGYNLPSVHLSHVSPSSQFHPPSREGSSLLSAYPSAQQSRADVAILAQLSDWQADEHELDAAPATSEACNVTFSFNVLNSATAATTAQQQQQQQQQQKQPFGSEALFFDEQPQRPSDPAPASLASDQQASASAHSNGPGSWGRARAGLMIVGGGAASAMAAGAGEGARGRSGTVGGTAANKVASREGSLSEKAGPAGAPDLGAEWRERSAFEKLQLGRQQQQQQQQQQPQGEQPQQAQQARLSPPRPPGLPQLGGAAHGLAKAPAPPGAQLEPGAGLGLPLLSLIKTRSSSSIGMATVGGGDVSQPTSPRAGLHITGRPPLLKAPSPRLLLLPSASRGHSPSSSVELTPSPRELRRSTSGLPSLDAISPVSSGGSFARASPPAAAAASLPSRSLLKAYTFASARANDAAGPEVTGGSSSFGGPGPGLSAGGRPLRGSLGALNMHSGRLERTAEEREPHERHSALNGASRALEPETRAPRGDAQRQVSAPLVKLSAAPPFVG